MISIRRPYYDDYNNYDYFIQRSAQLNLKWLDFIL